MDTIRVAAGILTDGCRILITRRAPEENFAGKWEFPGGKIENHETEQECLVRELKEELDIDVVVGEFLTEVLHDYGSFKVKLKTYYCTITGGTISVSVHDKYKWVHANELLNYELLPADIPVVKQLMETTQHSPRG
ncbi:MAG: (deoxy)nucleoside triphosphate pyrophosphohydrolase [Firmicutes bacterium]|nr:(deoxy)nucleoside triphosphate pyrophosphohydrolase [Bacillota bacterium]